MSAGHRRKLVNFSIKRHMQMRLFLRVLSIAMAGIGLMALIFYFYSSREINGTFRQFHIQAQNFLDYLLPTVIMSTLAAILFAAAITVFFPHKIAGPLYRIEKELKNRVSEGDFTVRFTIRKGDEVSDLPETVNLLLDKLRYMIEKAKRPAEELYTITSETEGNAYRDIEGLVRRINDALAEFRV